MSDEESQVCILLLFPRMYADSLCVGCSRLSSKRLLSMPDSLTPTNPNTAQVYPFWTPSSLSVKAITVALRGDELFPFYFRS